MTPSEYSRLINTSSTKKDPRDLFASDIARSNMPSGEAFETSCVSTAQWLQQVMVTIIPFHQVRLWDLSCISSDQPFRQIMMTTTMIMKIITTITTTIPTAHCFLELYVLVPPLVRFKICFIFLKPNSLTAKSRGDNANVQGRSKHRDGLPIPKPARVSISFGESHDLPVHKAYSPTGKQSKRIDTVPTAKLRGDHAIARARDDHPPSGETLKIFVDT